MALLWIVSIQIRLYLLLIQRTDFLLPVSTFQIPCIEPHGSMEHFEDVICSRQWIAILSGCFIYLAIIHTKSCCTIRLGHKHYWWGPIGRWWFNNSWSLHWFNHQFHFFMLSKWNSPWGWLDRRMISSINLMLNRLVRPKSLSCCANTSQ